MVYPNNHCYITFHWTTPFLGAEEGQFGLRVDFNGKGTTAEQDAVMTAAQTFWSTATTEIPTTFSLYMLKFAIIGVDGKYAGDSEADFREYATPVTGGGGSNVMPPQCALVTSLLTASPRGRAHRGRLYMPPAADALTSSGMWSSSIASNRAAATKTLLDAINTALPGSVAVFSSLGVGTKKDVTSVAVGTRPDVQRRRARSIPEAYQTAVLA